MVTFEQAAKVYEILVRECDADPAQSLAFVQYMTAQHTLAAAQGGREWRFGGRLGYGGKFYLYEHVWRVNCYPEDINPARRQLMFRVNDMIGHIEAGRSL